MGVPTDPAWSLLLLPVVAVVPFVALVAVGAACDGSTGGSTAG